MKYGFRIIIPKELNFLYNEQRKRFQTLIKNNQTDIFEKILSGEEEGEVNYRDEVYRWEKVDHETKSENPFFNEDKYVFDVKLEKRKEDIELIMEIIRNNYLKMIRLTNEDYSVCYEDRFIDLNGKPVAYLFQRRYLPITAYRSLYFD